MTRSSLSIACFVSHGEGGGRCGKLCASSLYMYKNKDVFPWRIFTRKYRLPWPSEPLLGPGGGLRATYGRRGQATGCGQPFLGTLLYRVRTYYEEPDGRKRPCRGGR